MTNLKAKVKNKYKIIKQVAVYIKNNFRLLLIDSDNSCYITYSINDYNLLVCSGGDQRNQQLYSSFVTLPCLIIGHLALCHHYLYETDLCLSLHYVDQCRASFSTLHGRHSAALHWIFAL